jgi:ubiquinone/menaquinone biosynthesis C-methylase UbiE
MSDINKEVTRKRFDSFHDWSRKAMDREFNTAVWAHINMSEMTVVSRLLDDIPAGGRAIACDVGCGSGRFLFDLRRRYGKAVGCDFSMGLLKKAAAHKPGSPELIQSEIEHLPFKDGSFDILLCVRVIQHLGPGQQQAAVIEMARVLKRGGRLILMTYNALTLLCLYKLVNMCGLNRVWPRWPLRDWRWPVDDYSTAWELARIFRNAGLKPRDIRGAVCGEPEMFKFLKIDGLLEKYFGLLFRAWFAAWRNADFSLNRLRPFRYLMGRVLITGEKL